MTILRINRYIPLHKDEEDTDDVTPKSNSTSTFIIPFLLKLLAALVLSSGWILWFIQSSSSRECALPSDKLFGDGESYYDFIQCRLIVERLIDCTW